MFQMRGCIRSNKTFLIVIMKIILIIHILWYSIIYFYLSNNTCGVFFMCCCFLLLAYVRFLQVANIHSISLRTIKYVHNYYMDKKQHSSYSLQNIYVRIKITSQYSCLHYCLVDWSSICMCGSMVWVKNKWCNKCNRIWPFMLNVGVYKPNIAL